MEGNPEIKREYQEVGARPEEKAAQEEARKQLEELRSRQAQEQSGSSGPTQPGASEQPKSETGEKKEEKKQEEDDPLDHLEPGIVSEFLVYLWNTTAAPKGYKAISEEGKGFLKKHTYRAEKKWLQFIKISPELEAAAAIGYIFGVPYVDKNVTEALAKQKAAQPPAGEQKK